MAIRRPELIVFFEGIRLVPTSVSITAGANRPSTCTIGLPPTTELKDLPPRTRVEVYFRDFFEETGDRAKDFRLLWDGEYHRFGVTRSANQWVASVACQDLSNYWNHVYGIFEPGLGDLTSDAVLAGSFGVDPRNVQFVTVTGLVFTAKVSQILSAVKSKNAVEQGVLAYFEDAMLRTPFFRAANKRLKLASTPSEKKGRIRVLDDPEAKILFQANQLSELIHMAVRNVPTYLTLRQVINRFTQFFFYRTWPVISPPFKDDRLLQVLLKPSTYYSAPAACNVLWPDDISEITYAQDHFLEPTRLRLTTMPMQRDPQAEINEQSLSYRYETYAPTLLADTLTQMMQARLKKAAGTVDTDIGVVDIREGDPQAIALAVSGLSGDKILKDDDLASDVLQRLSSPSDLAPVFTLKDPNLPIESREDLKGVLPLEIPLTHYAWNAIFTGDAGQRSANYIRRIADYMLSLKQHERPVKIRTTFNPYLLLGFPAVALDSVYTVFGEIGAITHDYTPRRSSTTIVLNYARTEDAVRYVHPEDIDETTGLPKDEINEEISRPKPDRDVPFWINGVYRPEHIGEKEFDIIQLEADPDTGNLKSSPTLVKGKKGAYQELFGIGSMFRELSDPDDKDNTIKPRAESAASPGKNLRFSQTEAAQLLLRIRSSRPTPESRDRFMNSFRKRPVATLAEVLSFIGAKIVNDDELENDPDVPTEEQPYREEVRKAVRKIRAAIRLQGRGLVS